MGSSNGRRKKTARNSDPRAVADLERPAGHEQVAANEVPSFDSRVGITVLAYRCRLIDTDGLAAKAAIDAIVACGVIRDDSAREVAWVRYEACVKVKDPDEEKTVIIIEEV